MRLFRSEEHVDRFNAATRQSRGALFSVAQCWDLAQRWFGDRLSPQWRRRTPDEAQAIFDVVGLTDPFWRLAPP